MNWFNKLPQQVKTPPGKERQVLRRLPAILLWGTLILALLAVVARLFPWSGTEVEVAARLGLVDIYLISLAVLHWTVVLTAAIGAFIIMVMKGPAYVADAYAMEDDEARHLHSLQQLNTGDQADPPQPNQKPQ